MIEFVKVIPISSAVARTVYRNRKPIVRFVLQNTHIFASSIKMSQHVQVLVTFLPFSYLKRVNHAMFTHSFPNDQTTLHLFSTSRPNNIECKFDYAKPTTTTTAIIKPWRRHRATVIPQHIIAILSLDRRVRNGLDSRLINNVELDLIWLSVAGYQFDLALSNTLRLQRGVKSEIFLWMFVFFFKYTYMHFIGCVVAMIHFFWND